MNSPDRVLEACQRLWQKRGLKDFTMDELAAEAGLSKRTVYKHFRSKEEILTRVVERMMEDISAESQRLLDEGCPAEAIFQHMMDYLLVRGSFLTSQRSLEEILRYYPHLWQKISDFRLQRLDYVVNTVTGRPEASTPPGIDASIAKAVIISSINTILDPRFLLENGFSFKEASRQVFRLMVMMLGLDWPPSPSPSHSQ